MSELIAFIAGAMLGGAVSLVVVCSCVLAGKGEDR